VLDFLRRCPTEERRKRSQGRGAPLFLSLLLKLRGGEGKRERKKRSRSISSLARGVGETFCTLPLVSSPERGESCRLQPSSRRERGEKEISFLSFSLQGRRKSRKTRVSSRRLAARRS